MLVRYEAHDHSPKCDTVTVLTVKRLQGDLKIQRYSYRTADDDYYEGYCRDHGVFGVQKAANPRVLLVDWTGLTQKSVRCLFQCRTEAKHTYLFTKVACIACFSVFPRVGRGQRSRAYLMSSSKLRFSQLWMIEEYYFLFLCFSKRLEFDVCGK